MVLLLILITKKNLILKSLFLNLPNSILNNKFLYFLLEKKVDFSVALSWFFHPLDGQGSNSSPPPVLALMSVVGVGTYKHSNTHVSCFGKGMKRYRKE